MNSKKVIVSFILATVLIAGGGVLVLSQTMTNPASVTSSQNAKVEVDSKNYDWGQIPYSGGNVTKTFNIKNTGSDSLKLTNIKTSCTCTQAYLTINGSKSPSFSMHSNSAWVGEIDPGKIAQLTVVFDPAFHGPSGVGPIERLISVQTNDINNSNLEFSLKGVVVK